MNLDLSPMQFASTPNSQVLGQPATAASDQFAALLDLGEVQSAPTVAAAPGPAIGARSAATGEPESNAVIALADALVSALSPQNEQRPEAPAVARQPDAQATMLAAARQLARRFGELPPEAVESSPQDQLEEDASEKSDEDAALADPLQMAQLPSTQATIQPPLSAANDIGLNNKFQTEADEPILDEAPLSTPAKALEAGRTTPAPVETELAAPTVEAAAAPAQKPTEGTKSDSRPGAEPATQSILAEVPEFARSRTSKPEPKLDTIVSEVSLPDGVRIASALPVSRGPSDVAASITTPVAAAQASSADSVVDRQLDVVRNERWLGELAQDIASASKENDRLSFRLLPRQLGQLDIDLSRSHNGLSLTIRTETDSAQSILTAAQPRLADELRAQGVKLADTQMLSGNASQSHHQRNEASRPAPLIENFTSPLETADAPEQVQRDGRYA